MTNNLKLYQVYASGFWCIAIYLGIGVILPLIVLATINNVNMIFLFTVFGVTSIIGNIGAKKYGLRPINIQFDQEKIIFEFLTNDLEKIKKTKSFTIDSINGFSDFNFGGNKTFKLKLKNKSEFTIYKNKYWNRNDDFEKLIRDFKAFIKKYNSPFEPNPNSISENLPKRKSKIEYKDFFQTQTATIILWIVLGLSVLMLFLSALGQTKSLSSTLIALVGLIGYAGTYIAKRANRNK